MATNTITQSTCFRVSVELDSIEKFYTMVNWLNANTHKGGAEWTSTGKIKKHIAEKGKHRAEITVTSSKVTHSQLVEFFNQL